jgi:hypothetical protein
MKHTYRRYSRQRLRASRSSAFFCAGAANRPSLASSRAADARAAADGCRVLGDDWTERDILRWANAHREAYGWRPLALGWFGGPVARWLKAVADPPDQPAAE